MQLAPTTATDTDLRDTLDTLADGLVTVLSAPRYDNATLATLKDAYIITVEALHRRRLMRQQEVAAVEAGVRAAIAAIGSR